VDPLAIAQYVSCLAIAKAEVSRWPLLGARGRGFGIIYVERESVVRRALALRAAYSALKDGVSILNFPEGTTCDDGVLPFYRGIFGVARRLRIPVVPVRIDYDDPSINWVGDALFLPHVLRLSTRTSAGARIHFGSPIATQPSDDPREL